MKTIVHYLSRIFCTFILCSGVMILSCQEVPLGVIDGTQDNEEVTGDITNPDNGHELSAITAIRPVRVQLDGVKSLGVVAHDPTMTKSSDLEESNTPYAMYSLDESGNVYLTIFQYEIDSPDMDADEKAEQEQIASQSVRLVPSLISDVEKYLLFTDCRLYLDEELSSEELIKAFEELGFYSDESSGPQKTYLVRKSDGAIFDITDYPYFSYITPNAYVTIDPHSRFEYYGSSTYYPGTMLDNRKYQLFKDGSLYISTAGGQVYKLNDSDSSIEIRQITHNNDYARYFFIDDFENLIFCSGYEWYAYLSGGGFTKYEDYFHMGEYTTIFVQNGKFYLFSGDSGGRNSLVNVGIYNGTINFEQVAEFWEIDHWHYDRFYGVHDGKPVWAYISNADVFASEKITYDFATGKLTFTTLPYEFRDKHFWQVGVDLKMSGIDYVDNGNSIIISYMTLDVVTETVESQSKTVELPPMIDKNCYHDGVNFYVTGRSTADGSEINLVISIFGDEEAEVIFGGDDRTVVTVFKLN